MSNVICCDLCVYHPTHREGMNILDSRSSYQHLILSLPSTRNRTVIIHFVSVDKE